MIHHLSIAAAEPERVARVLADLMKGRSFPFPVFPGAFIALQGDGHGTAVEVLPLDQELVPGAGADEVRSRTSAHPARASATHFALSTELDQDAILALGAREGWRSVPCERENLFGLVEIWIENRILVEVLSPREAARYLDFLTIPNYERFLAEVQPA